MVLPNVAGVVTSVAGGAKFGWLGRFVNVASKRSFIPSLMAKLLAIPPETATVPGPTRIPHRQSIPTLTEPPLGTVLPTPKMRPKWGETHANSGVGANAIVAVWRKIDQFSAHGSARR